MPNFDVMPPSSSDLTRGQGDLSSLRVMTGGVPGAFLVTRRDDVLQIIKESGHAIEVAVEDLPASETKQGVEAQLIIRVIGSSDASKNINLYKGKRANVELFGKKIMDVLEAEVFPARPSAPLIDHVSSRAIAVGIASEMTTKNPSPTKTAEEFLPHLDPRGEHPSISDVQSDATLEDFPTFDLPPEIYQPAKLTDFHQFEDLPPPRSARDEFAAIGLNIDPIFPPDEASGLSRSPRQSLLQRLLYPDRKTWVAYGAVCTIMVAVMVFEGVALTHPPHTDAVNPSSVMAASTTTLPPVNTSDLPPAPPSIAKNNTANQVVELTDSEEKQAGHDLFGIPDVLSSNVWILTGGKINLPLPGGGTVTDPKELSDFGVHP